MVESFKLGLFGGIEKAAEIEADGVQIRAAAEAAPDILSRTQRIDLKNKIVSKGLEVSAVCGEIGGYGFERADGNKSQIEKIKKAIDLAVELSAPVVTTHIGVVPEDDSCDRWKIMAAACAEVASCAAAEGITFAIETGPEPCLRLKAFLDKISSKGIGVNFDPANLVMVIGDDPAAGVSTLGPYIVHTHAKDGRMLKQESPEIIYHAFAESDFDFDYQQYFIETPLGEGDVDFDGYTRALEQIGYSGYLTIEREVGADPVGDIVKARRFLEKYR